jgi:hypothetical protein
MRRNGAVDLSLQTASMKEALWKKHRSGRNLASCVRDPFGMPPDTFWMDRDFVTGRWMTDPSLAFGAWMGDRFVGSSLGTSWGSLGVFGPISTHPDTWNRGIARSRRCSSG